MRSSWPGIVVVLLARVLFSARMRGWIHGLEVAMWTTLATRHPRASDFKLGTAVSSPILSGRAARGDGMDDKAQELEQLTDLVSGEIDRQLRHRGDALETIKSQMTKVLKEFEELTWNVQAKRSWMRSIGKTREIYPTNPSGVAIHPVSTAGNIGATSPSKLPKLSGLKARKKLQQQLNRNISGSLPQAEGVPSDARDPGGKIVFDKKLPRVANIEKRADGLQALLANQQKQIMYDKALVRYPQCRSNVFAPSIFDEEEGKTSQLQIPQSAPHTSLELEFVYGVNHGSTSTGSLSQTNGLGSCGSTSPSIFYLSTGEIMWYTASIVVLYTRLTNTQRYFREHTNQVTSAALHPNQHIVASGQAGRETFVLVWDSNEDTLGKRFACLKGHSVSVRSVSFSHDGKLVASLGGDMYNTICVHDWREQILLVTARGHSFRVHTLAFNPYQAYGRPETKRGKRPGQALQDDDVCYTLVSCGVRHIRFWTLTKTEYASPPSEENEQSAFYGSTFGGPARLQPPSPHETTWKLEGNVPSFHGRLDVQDFTTITFVDDSPPLYIYDDQAKQLIASNSNDHSLGRVIAGTAKGDICVFWQPRRGPGVDDLPTKDREKEPAKWWEIPDEYSDAEINELVLERVVYEPTGRLVDLVPHDVETGNRFKISKQTQLEIDGINKRLQVKPNSASLHTRLAELKYSGPLAHQGCAYQLAYTKKNDLIISSGADGRLVLWKCLMTQTVRVPGVNTQGIFTPLTGTFSEGQHKLMPLDEGTRVFYVPTTQSSHDSSQTHPPGNATFQPKATSVYWKDDGTHVIVGTSNSCIWELDITSGEWTLVFEGRSGYLATSCCHPLKEEVATVSYDGYLCIWDLREHTCRRRVYVGGDRPPMHVSSPKPTSMEFHPSGEEIVVGMSNGELVIVSYDDLRITNRRTIRPYVGTSATNNSESVTSCGSQLCVAQLKFDPNGRVLAVASKDTYIYIMDTSNGYKKLHVCEGHSSAVTQLTWSEDASVLLSNAADGEALFWSRSNTSMKQITDTFQVRDLTWVKWTCVFGWPTPGIWGDESSSLVDITAVAASEKTRKMLDPEDLTKGSIAPVGTTEDLLVVANRNTVRLFRWPVPRGSKCKTYHAHSSLVTSVGFTFNGRSVVTTGGDDGTLLQWKCECSQENFTNSTHRTTKRRAKFNINNDDEPLRGATPSPVPPQGGGRGSNGHSSPRQVSRQYRRLSKDRELDEHALAEVSMEGPESQPSPPTLPFEELSLQCRATHDFRAENADELNLTAGELIRVLSKDGEWWTGESCDGTRGIFPSTYVTEIAEVEGSTEGEGSGAAIEEPTPLDQPPADPVVEEDAM